jgi:hypothetical protein
VVTTDAQVRRLMEELERQGTIEVAALRSGMHRNTATKYRRLGKLPSELKQPRQWRTREDPFTEDWPAILQRLRSAPELEAKALFEDLVGRLPGRYQPGQLRTFQRKVKQWRAQEGPPKEIFFSQVHRPGEAMQTDFTWAIELGVTIAGEPLRHLLCHPVLPYSNWESVTVCFSESLAALRRGVQKAVFTLGRVPRYHQTDNSTSATHDLGRGKRDFNDAYASLMRHLGMEPRTIAVGEKQQNGDVEALNGALKRRLEQHLLLRGDRDFESQAAYESFLDDVVGKANRLREGRFKEELAAMRCLAVSRLPEYQEETVRVTSWGTIRVGRNTYSVPSRLRGEQIRVRIYDERLEVVYGGRHQLTIERLRGEGRHRIDYRHVIASLVRKPGAFARYRFREEFFPRLVFRQTYDRLVEAFPAQPVKADLEYLRILDLATSRSEAEVAEALEVLLLAAELPASDALRALVAPQRPDVPEVAAVTVDLAAYDALLCSEAAP